MRRAAALLVFPLLAAAAAAGCGSSSSSSSAQGTSNSAVTVTGKFGAAPKVTIPAEKAGGTLYIKTLIQGTGSPLTTAQTLKGNFALYDWSGTTHKLLGSTYTTGSPTLFVGQVIPGLEKAIIGEKVGSRVLAVIPPKDAFGSKGNPNAGVKGTDTLVFVIDLDQAYTVTAAPGKAPAVTIPSSTPPKSLQVKALIKGTGPKVAAGQELLVQYTGINWRTKKAFDSSWSRSQPYPVQIGAGQVIKGWDTGLVGQTVGSRVLLVIPPADGYGTAGQATAGIKGTDTLIFVVDIITAVGA